MFHNSIIESKLNNIHVFGNKSKVLYIIAYYLLLINDLQRRTCHGRYPLLTGLTTKCSSILVKICQIYLVHYTTVFHKTQSIFHSVVYDD